MNKFSNAVWQQKVNFLTTLSREELEDRYYDLIDQPISQHGTYWESEMNYLKSIVIIHTKH